eukprot:373017_1
MNILNVFVITMVLFISKMKANVEIKVSDDELSCLTSFFYVIDHSFTAIALDFDGNIYYAVDSAGGDSYDYKWISLGKQYESMIFRDITVGSINNIWGINNAARSYRYSFLAKKWVDDEKNRQQISRQISAATDGSVIFARNGDNKLYYTYSEVISWKSFDSTHTWEYISVGSMDQIYSVGNGRVYKLSDLPAGGTDNIYVGCTSTGACFDQLSVGQFGTVIGIDDNDDLWYLSIDDNGSKQKQKICAYGISKISVVTKSNILAIIDGKIVEGYFV